MENLQLKIKKIYRTDDLSVYKVFDQVSKKKYIVKKSSKKNLEYENEIYKFLKNRDHSLPYSHTNDFQDSYAIWFHDEELHRPLKTYFRNPSVSKFLKISTQIIKAINSLHQQGLVHNQINPKTIFTDAKQTTIYLDNFTQSSLSKNEWTNKFRRKSFFTEFCYISPELTGFSKHSVDYRSDYYSLGIIFFQMIFGKLPLHSSKYRAWIIFHLSKKSNIYGSPIFDIPPSMISILVKMLKTDPTERYSSAEEIIHDIQFAFKYPHREIESTIISQRKGVETRTYFEIWDHIKYQFKSDQYENVSNIDTRIFPNISFDTVLKLQEKIILEGGYFAYTNCHSSKYGNNLDCLERPIYDCLHHLKILDPHIWNEIENNYHPYMKSTILSLQVHFDSLKHLIQSNSDFSIPMTNHSQQKVIYNIITILRFFAKRFPTIWIIENYKDDQSSAIGIFKSIQSAQIQGFSLVLCEEDSSENHVSLETIKSLNDEQVTILNYASFLGHEFDASILFNAVSVPRESIIALVEKEYITSLDSLNRHLWLDYTTLNQLPFRFNNYNIYKTLKTTRKFRTTVFDYKKIADFCIAVKPENYSNILQNCIIRLNEEQFSHDDRILFLKELNRNADIFIAQLNFSNAHSAIDQALELLQNIKFFSDFQTHWSLLKKKASIYVIQKDLDSANNVIETMKKLFAEKKHLDFSDLLSSEYSQIEIELLGNEPSFDKLMIKIKKLLYETKQTSSLPTDSQLTLYYPIFLSKLIMNTKTNSNLTFEAQKHLSGLYWQLLVWALKGKKKAKYLLVYLSYTKISSTKNNVGIIYGQIYLTHLFLEMKMYRTSVALYNQIKRSLTEFQDFNKWGIQYSLLQLQFTMGHLLESKNHITSEAKDQYLNGRIIGFKNAVNILPIYVDKAFYNSKLDSVQEIYADIVQDSEDNFVSILLKMKLELFSYFKRSLFDQHSKTFGFEKTIVNFDSILEKTKFNNNNVYLICSIYKTILELLLFYSRFTNVNHYIEKSKFYSKFIQGHTLSIEISTLIVLIQCSIKPKVNNWFEKYRIAKSYKHSKGAIALQYFLTLACTKKRTKKSFLTIDSYFNYAYKSAIETNNYFYQGIINEKRSLFYNEYGLSKTASHFNFEAIQNYHRWGAELKVSQLNKKTCSTPTILSNFLQLNENILSSCIVDHTFRSSYLTQFKTILDNNLSLSNFTANKDLIQKILQEYISMFHFDRILLLSVLPLQKSYISLGELNKENEYLTKRNQIVATDSICLQLVDLCHTRMHPIVVTKEDIDPNYLILPIVNERKISQILATPILKGSTISHIIYAESSIVNTQINHNSLLTFTKNYSLLPYIFENFEYQEKLNSKLEKLNATIPIMERKINMTIHSSPYPSAIYDTNNTALFCDDETRSFLNLNSHIDSKERLTLVKQFHEEQHREHDNGSLSKNSDIPLNFQEQRFEVENNTYRVVYSDHVTQHQENNEQIQEIESDLSIAHSILLNGANDFRSSYRDLQLALEWAKMYSLEKNESQIINTCITLLEWALKWRLEGLISKLGIYLRLLFSQLTSINRSKSNCLEIQTKETFESIINLVEKIGSVHHLYLGNIKDTKRADIVNWFLFRRDLSTSNFKTSHYSEQQIKDIYNRIDHTSHNDSGITEIITYLCTHFFTQLNIEYEILCGEYYSSPQLEEIVTKCTIFTLVKEYRNKIEHVKMNSIRNGFTIQFRLNRSHSAIQTDNTPNLIFREQDLKVIENDIASLGCIIRHQLIGDELTTLSRYTISKN
ncbi:protein kinase [Bacteriovoracaceae bacterium]|nr:protein kinase [Bacteriovoracaceae bacterium]